LILGCISLGYPQPRSRDPVAPLLATHNRGNHRGFAPA